MRKGKWMERRVRCSWLGRRPCLACGFHGKRYGTLGADGRKPEGEAEAGPCRLTHARAAGDLRARCRWVFRAGRRWERKGAAGCWGRPMVVAVGVAGKGGRTLGYSSSISQYVSKRAAYVSLPAELVAAALLQVACSHLYRALAFGAEPNAGCGSPGGDLEVCGHSGE